MDQVKIGKYIAEKRKDLGYTQAQLAEKLGMSDKSVSKWERGVCLPDVSAYEKLCEELGISINEFLAGEDIEAEKVVKKSEENLLKVSWFMKKKSRTFKKIIAVIVALIILLIGIFVEFLYSEGYFLQNYISAYAEESTQREVARLLAGREGIFLYEYHVDDKYDFMNIKMTTYHNGIVYEEPVEIPLGFMDGEPKEGDIVFVPDSINGKINVILTSGAGAMSLESYFECEKWTVEGYATSYTEIQGKQEIEQGKEVPILALFYDEDCSMTIPAVEDIEDRTVERLQEDDLCYYFTVTFDEAENQVLE